MKHILPYLANTGVPRNRKRSTPLNSLQPNLPQMIEVTKAEPWSPIQKISINPHSQVVTNYRLIPHELGAVFNELR
jgi:hypothetical protein